MSVPIVAVHGVWNYRGSATDAVNAAEELSGELGASLGRPLSAAYYADVLRSPHAAQGTDGLDELTPSEEAILLAWAAQHGVTASYAQGKATKWLRDVLSLVAEREHRRPDKSRTKNLITLISRFIRDTACYLDNLERRHRAQDRVREAIVRAAEEDPLGSIVIAHSLGSVVTYETLCRFPELKVRALLTVGSPLAFPGAIFDRLQPVPVPGTPHRVGQCPPQITNLVNLAEIGDLVAVPRKIYPYFTGIKDEPRVEFDGFAFHGFREYLASEPVRQAVQTSVRWEPET